jgi:hypothetical protein
MHKKNVLKKLVKHYTNPLKMTIKLLFWMEEIEKS